MKVNTANVSLTELGTIASAGFNMVEDISFPIINGKSPSVFTINNWADGAVSLEVLIEEIGGIPDPNYFSDTPTVIPEIIQDETTEQEEEQDAI